MKVTYNFHSCFTVELDSHILVFDYYLSDDKNNCLQGLDESKEIVFFASHRHHDHFSNDIFEYKNIYPKTKFIISDDIWMKNSGEPIDFVSPNESYDFGDIRVMTLKSTDEGVAFVVEVEGKSIYYAGDLHWWYWEEKGPDYIKLWGDRFLDEIKKISDRSFDIAFMLLDPRMGNGYAKGMELFLETVPNVPIIFPMHMWGRYDLIERFKEDYKDTDYAKKLVDISENGQEFIVD